MVKRLTYRQITPIKLLLKLAGLTIVIAGSAVAAETLRMGPVAMTIEAHGMRYSFSYQGQTIITADASGGLFLNGQPASIAGMTRCETAFCEFGVATEGGSLGRVKIAVGANHATLTVTPAEHGSEVRFVTGGATPAYGLADHVVLKRPFDTDVSGFADDHYLSGQQITRLVGNFLIYPQAHFALVLPDPREKIVHTSKDQIVEGVTHAEGSVTLHYFFGSPHEIYREYRNMRSQAGYPVLRPKYAMFGVGWEAFGALGWDTNQTTVRENVDRYLAAGFPLKWIVIGSGFWPSTPEMHETTSFGYFDTTRYPDFKELAEHFHQEGLKVLLGLRICFITTSPYAAEGVRKGFFLQSDGKAQVFRGSWPQLPYYLLNAQNSSAVDWYIGLAQKWRDAGVDGFKEDYFDFHGLRDDKVDTTNYRLMELGVYIIERNGYLSSNGDLHRIDDFNYEQNQDRGPVNALSLAYSGFPLVYPDIVGGTFKEERFKTERTKRMNIYMMRNAQWAALHSSMGMGEPPWSFDPVTAKIMLQAATLHGQLQPYLYSQAMRFSEDGYPWTMTPLPIAYPDNPVVYGRENTVIRGYEWLIGDALLATPLYGNDFDTANARDIYLPAGQWMDYDTGVLYRGKTMLRDFPLPPGKTPLFVGGSGVLLLQKEEGLVVCIFPVAQESEALFNLIEGSPVHIRVHGLPAGKMWNGVKILDETSGGTVEVRKQQFSFEFRPIAGHHYVVSAVR